MYIGQLLVVPSDGSSVSVLTPWMTRQADNIWITYEVFGKVGTPTLTVELLQKNSESASRDGGTGTTLSATATTVGASTFYTVRVTGLKELLRFRITLAGTTVLEDFKPESIFFRFHEPTWFNTAPA